MTVNELVSRGAGEFKGPDTIYRGLKQRLKPSEGP